MRPSHRLLLLALATFLASCAGGGSEPDTSSAPADIVSDLRSPGDVLVDPPDTEEGPDATDTTGTDLVPTDTADPDAADAAHPGDVSGEDLVDVADVGTGDGYSDTTPDSSDAVDTVDTFDTPDAADLDSTPDLYDTIDVSDASDLQEVVDPCTPDPCLNGGVCLDDGSCDCPDEWEGADCGTDVDECAAENGGCGAVAFWICTDNEGAPPTCTDIDECALENGGCGDAVFWNCTDNEGAPPTCVDIDECAVENGGCGDAAIWTCIDVDGGPPVCTGLNPCLVDNGGCDAHATCAPTADPAAPDCTCDAGYEGDGLTCTPVDGDQDGVPLLEDCDDDDPGLGALATDADCDGSPDAEDCVPNDPSVHPGALELCNGTDDDCVGGLEEETYALTVYLPSTNNIATSAGGVFRVDRPVRLRGLKVSIDGTDDMGISWWVLEGETEQGPWIQLHVHGTFADTGALAWHESGPMDLTLQADHHYVLRASFQQSKVRFGSSVSSSLRQTGWGELLGAASGYGSNWQPGSSFQHLRVVTGYDEDDTDLDDVLGCLDCDDDDPALGLVAADADCDGAFTADDCDDEDPLLGAIAEDGDCDGVPAVLDCDDGDPALPTPDDFDCDGTPAAGDCDDTDPGSHVRAEDADCDGVFTADDCDDLDEDFGAVALDGDCDGVLTADDCDDGDPDSYPGAPELCDGVDNDCDGSLVSGGLNEEDGDEDGTIHCADCDDNDPGSTVIEEDGDCDGVLTAVDCDDGDPVLGAVADDADCDGALTADDCDDGDPELGDIGLDADCDGALTADDCDDGDPLSHPGADWLCDGVDNDCDGVDDFFYTLEWLAYGNDTWAETSCFYGVKIRADDDAVLTGYALEMDKMSSSSGNLTWAVYEADAEDGPFTKIWQAATPNLWSGEHWHEPGVIAVPLDAGRYYALTVYSSLAFYVDASDVAGSVQPRTAAWGELLGAVQGTGLPSSSKLAPTADYCFQVRVVAGPGEADSDGDGQRDCEDCDDHEILAFTGAEEVCDEVDNDCDGLTDTDDPDIDDCGPVVCEGDREIVDESYLGDVSLCTEITGDLLIHATALTDLDGLEHLVAVGGDLIIQHNSQLTSLGGLAGLTSVVGDLTIYNNDQLPDLSGLSALSDVAGEFKIWSNDVLTGLDGLFGLVSLSGDLTVLSNPALMDLGGLEALTSISGTLHIQNNEALAQLTGLSSLSSVDGSLNILYNPALLDVDGLSGLLAVGAKLYIFSNAALANLSGLSGLTSVLLLEIKSNSSLQLISGFNNLADPVGFLDINFNNALTDISGFSSLTEVTYSMHINGNGGLTNLSGFTALQTVGSILQISNNSQLCTSLVEAFYEALTVIGNPVTPSGNDDGC